MTQIQKKSLSTILAVDYAKYSKEELIAIIKGLEIINKNQSGRIKQLEDANFERDKKDGVYDYAHGM